MAQSSGFKRAGRTKAAKPTRAEKKQLRATKRQNRRDTFRQMREAFTVTRRNDARLIPYLILAFVVTAVVIYLAGFFGLGSPWSPILPAVLFGLIAAMFVF